MKIEDREGLTAHNDSFAKALRASQREAALLGSFSSELELWMKVLIDEGV